MPELPEVEVVRLGLAPAVTGATVTAVEVLDSRSLRRHDGPAEDFVARLTGSRLRAPSRRGKYLWIPIDPDAVAGAPVTAVSLHLGMSGQVLRTPDAPRDRLTRVVIALQHPDAGPLRVDFVDQRIFGSVALDELVTPVDASTDAPAERIPASVRHIARDPLDPRFDDSAFLTALARKRTTIKRAVLDQTLVSGVGNIYADESLWMSRVHPEQPTETLSRRKATELLAAIREVFGQALAEGGTSFDAQYLNVNGESGYFSRLLKAYGREGEPCLRCGRPIIRVAFTNRSSHFCAQCQRLRTPNEVIPFG